MCPCRCAAARRHEGDRFYRSVLSFDPAIPAPEDEGEAAARIPVEDFSAGDVVLCGGELRVGFAARPWLDQKPQLLIQQLPVVHMQPSQQGEPGGRSDQHSSVIPVQ